MIYVDTSALGAIFFREPNAALVLSQIEAARPRGLIISAWTLTEMASVGAIKERTGVMDRATRRQTLALFQRFVNCYYLRPVADQPFFPGFYLAPPRQRDQVWMTPSSSSRTGGMTTGGSTRSSSGIRPGSTRSVVVSGRRCEMPGCTAPRS